MLRFYVASTSALRRLITRWYVVNFFFFFFSKAGGSKHQPISSSDKSRQYWRRCSALTSHRRQYYVVWYHVMKFSKTGGKQTSAPWLYGQDEAILTPIQRFCVASTSKLRRFITWREFSKAGGANIRSLALGTRRSSIVSDAALWRHTGFNITSSKIWYEAVLIHSLRKSKFIFYNCTWFPMSEGC